MGLSAWLAILLAGYFAFLLYGALKGRRSSGGSTAEMIQARGGIATTLLFLSYSATLFSTFTLVGVPDFFRKHGIATWQFIGVTDVAMGFVVLWFGARYRRVAEKENIRSVSALLTRRYPGGFARLVYILGIFVFLAPYVAIQIQGVSGLLAAITPDSVPLPSWLWSVAILLLIGVYSWVGGFRAIVYSDVAQGLILLTVIWVVAVTLTQSAGGLSQVFEGARAANAELMSAPGPSGLMSAQFVFASFLAILWMPVTQPQLTARLAATRSHRVLPTMALGIGVFAFLILLPTIVIGLIGATRYAELGTGPFLAQVLIAEQAPLIGALAVVGLLAAAMSTADSQLFALSSEAQIARSGSEERLDLKANRALIALFALGCLALSLFASADLATLARVSFAGTALLGPMIVLAVWSAGRRSLLSPAFALAALALFLASSFGYAPRTLGPLRLDLALFAAGALLALAEGVLTRARQG